MRGQPARAREEPAVAGRRAHALVGERRDERAQPVGAGPRVRVHEDEDLALGRGVRDGRAQVVNLLARVLGRPGDYRADARDASFGQSLPHVLGAGERGVFGVVGDEDDFVGRVVLREDGGEVHPQPFVESATGDEDGREGHVERAARVSLAPDVLQIAHPAAQRQQALRENERGEDVEEQHRVRERRAADSNASSFSARRSVRDRRRWSRSRP